MTLRRNRDELIDVREERLWALNDVELRDDSADELTLIGYASTFEPYEMYGGPVNGRGWIEQIDRHAFDKTLREKPDLHLLINHAGMPLARTKSGTLKLAADKVGLKVEAQLDRRDPEVQALEVKMRRKDMDEMSFAFRVKSQTWAAAPGFEEDAQSLRTINEVSLHKGDVSVVNWGANPTTHAEVKSVPEALKLLAECEPAELLELRADGELLRKAWDVLDALLRPDESEERAVSDTPWNFSQADYSIEQWRRACLIDMGTGDPGSKSRYKLPVKEPGGALNRNGVHAAAGRLNQVQGISAAKRAATARKLISLYRNQLKEDPPQHLVDMAGRSDSETGMSLHEALARQGLAAEDGSTLSLDDALAASA